VVQNGNSAGDLVVKYEDFRRVLPPLDFDPDEDEGGRGELVEPLEEEEEDLVLLDESFSGS